MAKEVTGKGGKDMAENGSQDPRRYVPPEIVWEAEAMAAEYERSNPVYDELQRTLWRFRDKGGKLVSPVDRVVAEKGRLQGELDRLKIELLKVNAGWNQAQKDARLMRETVQRLAKVDKERAEKKAELKEYLVKWRLLDGDGCFMGLNYVKSG